jgi:hypothetical protein
MTNLNVLSLNATTIDLGRLVGVLNPCSVTK